MDVLRRELVRYEQLSGLPCILILCEKGKVRAAERHHRQCCKRQQPETRASPSPAACRLRWATRSPPPCASTTSGRGESAGALTACGARCINSLCRASCCDVLTWAPKPRPRRYGNERGTIQRAAVEQDLGRGFRYVNPGSAAKPTVHEVPTILVGPGLWAHINPNKTRRDKAAAAGAPLARGLHSTLAPDTKMLWKGGNGVRRYPEIATDLSVYRENYVVGRCQRTAWHSSHVPFCLRRLLLKPLRSLCILINCIIAMCVPSALQTASTTTLRTKPCTRAVSSCRASRRSARPVPSSRLVRACTHAPIFQTD